MRIGALLLGAAAVAGLAAACGGSSGNPPATAAANGANNGFAAYTQCLERNGVVLPSASANPRGTGGVRPSNRPSARPSGGTGNGGGFGGGGFGGFAFGNNPPAGVDQATWDKAMQACASVRPSFSAGGANNSALVAYRNCLTEHGVTFPSGGPRGGTGSGGGFAGLNTADPKVAAALTACEPLRPTGGTPRTTRTP
jgi:hypothetical protein